MHSPTVLNRWCCWFLTLTSCKLIPRLTGYSEEKLFWYLYMLSYLFCWLFCRGRTVQNDIISLSLSHIRLEHADIHGVCLTCMSFIVNSLSHKELKLDTFIVNKKIDYCLLVVLSTVMDGADNCL